MLKFLFDARHNFAYVLTILATSIAVNHELYPAAVVIFVIGVVVSHIGQIHCNSSKS